MLQYHGRSVGTSQNLYVEYFRKAPKCDAAFARNCYFLAAVSLELQNYQDFCYYYEQGIEHEMDRLPFQAAVNIQAKRCFFGLYLATDTTEMSFCNNCFRIETSHLISTCSCCRSVGPFQLSGGTAYKKITKTLLKVTQKRHKPAGTTFPPFIDSLRQIMDVLKSIEEKFCRVNRLIEMTKKISDYCGHVSVRLSSKQLAISDAETVANKLSGMESGETAVAEAEKPQAGSYNEIVEIKIFYCHACLV